MSDPKRLSAGPLAAARERIDKQRELAATPAPRPGPPADDDELARLRHEGRAELREQVWRAMVPSRFLHARLEHFEGTVGEALQQWSDHQPAPNLLLLGPVGVGKTHAAVAACRSAFERGLDVLFRPVVELLDHLRPGGPEGELERLSFVDRLIVDDLGSQRPTDWTAERLYALINRRWLEETPTVATSNLDPDTLRDELGERTFSRLVGNGALVLQLAGDDKRRRRT